ncbi:MAG: hypothetical protein HGA23_08830 [Bacteroidales bacterium]|nr:hypothetical protein [Bacteroidales bacterium]
MNRITGEYRLSCQHLIIQSYSILAVKESGLKLDIAAPPKTALSMTDAIDQYLFAANKK